MLILRAGPPPAQRPPYPHMKTTRLLFAFLLLSAGTFGQTVADETAIKTLLEQSIRDAFALRQADYDAGFANRPTTLIAYNTRSGYNLPATGSLAEIFGTKARQVKPVCENYVMKFYGPAAARVSYDQYLYGKANNKPSKEFRLVEKVNGAWKIDAIIALWDYGQNAYEEGLVRLAIEAETRAYLTANKDTYLAQWAEKPYNERQHASLTSMAGAPYLKGERLVAFGENFFKTWKGTDHTVRHTDYDVHISGETAWATYTQEELDKAGVVVAKQREIRILERTPTSQKAAWKIVFLGLQDMK